MAGQTGSSVAGAVTGSSSFGDAVTGIAMSGADALLNAQIKKTSKSEKEKKKQLKEEKKHQKDLTKETKKGLSDREKATDKGVKNITTSTEQGNKEQSKGTELAQQTIVNATDAALNATLTAKQKNNDETLKSDAARTEGEVTFSIAGAMAKCFEFLGPIAGPIAAAVVMSTLMGLLQWALNSALEKKRKIHPKVLIPRSCPVCSPTTPATCKISARSSATMAVSIGQPRTASRITVCHSSLSLPPPPSTDIRHW